MRAGSVGLGLALGMPWGRASGWRPGIRAEGRAGVRFSAPSSGLSLRGRDLRPRPVLVEPPYYRY